MFKKCPQDKVNNNNNNNNNVQDMAPISLKQIVHDMTPTQRQQQSQCSVYGPPHKSNKTMFRIPSDTIQGTIQYNVRLFEVI